MMAPLHCGFGLGVTFLTEFDVKLVDSVLSFQRSLQLVRGEPFAVVLESNTGGIAAATETVKAINRKRELAYTIKVKPYQATRSTSTPRTTDPHSQGSIECNIPQTC